MCSIFSMFTLNDTWHTHEFFMVTSITSFGDAIESVKRATTTAPNSLNPWSSSHPERSSVPVKEERPCELPDAIPRSKTKATLAWEDVPRRSELRHAYWGISHPDWPPLPGEKEQTESHDVDSMAWLHWPLDAGMFPLGMGRSRS
jgi:hypothetical protein